MSLEETLSQRSNGACELCTSTNNLTAYQVPPESALASMDNNILVCDTCAGQITSGDLDANHWRCLNDSMWSQVPTITGLILPTLDIGPTYATLCAPHYPPYRYRSHTL